MSQEAEKILTDVAQVRNESTRGKITKKAKRYLRFKERKAKEAEIESIANQLAPTNIGKVGLSSQGRADLIRYKRHLEDEMEESAPPTDLSGDAKNALYAEEKRLAEYIREGMLTEEDNRRNPVGAVDRHIRWEKTKKDAILKWKNIRVLLNPDADEQDLANVEQLRPRMAAPGQAATFMVNSQIPGQFAMTPQAKENFGQVFPDSPTIDTPLKQAEKNEEGLKARIAQLEAEIAADKQRKDAIKKARQENLEKARAKKKPKAELASL